MKVKVTAIALLLTLGSMLSSCFLTHDPHGRRTDRGRRYPHDRPQEQRQ